MVTADWIFIAVLVAAAALGLLLGFGRSLKMLTGGIFGVLISMFVCFMIGGTLQSISFIADYIVRLDNWFGSLWSFLGYLHLGIVGYYLLLFIVVQIIRLIIVRVISQLAETPNDIVRVINKALGVVFVAAFCLSLTLLGLAGLKVLEHTSFAAGIIDKLGEGFLHTLFVHNPITFGL